MSQACYQYIEVAISIVPGCGFGTASGFASIEPHRSRRVCHAEIMPSAGTRSARISAMHGRLLLAVDTCGPSGSVALGRQTGRDLEILGETALEGRSYSATLIAAVADLLTTAGAAVTDLGGIVAVNGPGSFTGVRVGLSAVKGLAEGAQIPVAAVSRLMVLARKAAVPSAALDAHRGEVFLRVERVGRDAEEMLAGPGEMALINPVPVRIAVCDDAAAAMLAAAWPQTQLVRVAAPLASDAMRPGEAMLAAGLAQDLALLDGHYLRRSDAEIFGPANMTQSPVSPRRAQTMSSQFAINIRPVAESDVGSVVKIADGLYAAPHWPRETFVSMLSGEFAARRMALVAADAHSGEAIGFTVASLVAPEAELESIAVAEAYQRRGIGRQLLVALVAALRHAGIEALHLEVRASNQPAIGFYGSLGFSRAGRRSRYYADPVEDAVLMTLRLG